MVMGLVCDAVAVKDIYWEANHAYYVERNVFRYTVTVKHLFFGFSCLSVQNLQYPGAAKFEINGHGFLL